MWTKLVFALIMSTVCFVSAYGQGGGNSQVTEQTAQPNRRKVVPRLQTLNLNGDLTEVIPEAFRLYGIDVIFIGPIQDLGSPLHIDLRDADLATMGRVLNAMSHCLFVPVGSHLVLVVQDDKEHRAEYDRSVAEMAEVPNMQAGNAAEQAEVIALLNTVFAVPKASMHGSTVVFQAHSRELPPIVNTLTALFQPPPQVLLNVKAYLLSSGRSRNTGIQTPQNVTVFNILTEAENLIDSNPSVVEGLIQSGEVAVGDTLGITEALVAGGYGTGSVLNKPFVDFGGGLTATGVETGPASVNLSLSTSTSQQLQDATLHLDNDQQGTLTVGPRYPVATSLTTALGGSASNSTPTVQYVDLGLTLEAKPHIEPDGEVLLHLHEMFRSLDGTSLNSIPIIDNQEFVSDISVPAGVTAVIVRNLSRTETRTVQGLATLIPTDSGRTQQLSDLVVTVTPILTRPGHLSR